MKSEPALLRKFAVGGIVSLLLLAGCGGGTSPSSIRMSGSKDRRPALDKLMVACRRRQVDAVVVYRYDRFARSLRQLVNALCEFNELGIQFISLHEGVDTSTANGRLVFGIFASIAEFERELIRERVRSGLQHAKSKGIRLGRPRLPDSSQQSRTTRWRRMRGSMEMHTTGSTHPGRGVNRESI
jgi:DNA invertase Pin-like site-specific DNA recombinase